MGQFVKATGEGNKERFEEFANKLSVAKNFEELVETIPLKVLEGIGPIEDFYIMYEIN